MRGFSFAIFIVGWLAAVPALAVDDKDKPKTTKLPSCDDIVSDCVDRCPQQSGDAKITVKRISPSCLNACRAKPRKGTNCN